ncbi:MAG: PQQ-binding-like beta-propeller repeat protein [Planctomycetota bacterium]|nr:MAG: PQQ-binding-like beta-propeller repeat protein [Planctomycetota bacterium]
MKYLILALSCLLSAVPCSAEIIIVDDDWPYDFNNIQAAIDYSADGDAIYVFPGTYSGPGNWDIDFNSRAVTVQSVDPLNPYIVAATVIDCNDVNYHAGFEFLSGEDANSLLAGLTVTNARFSIRCYNSSPTIADCVFTKSTQRAVYCTNSSPTIINCTIANNSGSSGAGIFCNNSSPTITNCDITENTGSNGGGIHCSSYSQPVITGCTITANTSDYHGGGIYCTQYGSAIILDSDISHNTSTRGGGICCDLDASITINNCTIIGNSTNSAVYPGGGIYCDSGDLTIHNSVITANTAEFGGGIYHIGGGKLTISGSTIVANEATVDTGGIYCFAGMAFLTNSILWANTDSGPTDLSAQIFGDPPQVTYSCIQDDNPDDGYVPFGAGDPNYNIDDDPCFVGYPSDFSDLHLQFNSPCIEAGLPNYIVGPNVLDIDGQPRVIGRQIDIGADEYHKIIIVTKPAGGEIWTAGSSHQINWESYGVTGNVTIFGLDHSVPEFLPIAESAPDTGAYTWNVPSSVDSNQLQVDVFPREIDITVTLVPSGLFTVKPYSPGPPIASKWKSLGGEFDRSGLSDNFGPEIGCIKWQFQTSAPVSASPAVADNNTVHIACEDGNLYTLDANDGSLLWTYEVNSPLLSSPSIGLDGTVYVGAQNGTLYAIDVNGYLQWTHTTSGFIYSSPAVSPDGNNIYVGSQDGSLYALARDGSELWTFQTAGPGIATGAIFASPAVGPDGTVYIAGVYDPNLYALDPDTGSVIWDCNFLDPCDPNTEKPWPFASPVVAPDGTMYQLLLYNPRRPIEEPDLIYRGFWYDSKLYAIDPNEGQILWATNMSQTATDVEYPDPEPPEPNYWFEQYYAYTREEPLPPYPHTITKAAGKDFVRYYRVSNSSYSEPALGPDGTIYVSLDDQYIRAVDPNGTIKGVTSLGWLGGFNLTIAADGLIYAAGDDGYLYVVDPDASEIARYDTDSHLSFPVITADGTIIVNDSNNIVTAIIDGECPGQPPALHRPEDLNTDWQMNFIDFAILAADWLDCTDTSYDPETRLPYCDYDGNDIFLLADINRDLYVDFFDLAQLAMRWLAQD